MHAKTEARFPPPEITLTLRIEGLVLLTATVIAFHLLGGNWWLFAALILAPDLAMFGALGGREVGSRIYNLAHTTAIPAMVGGIAWFAGATWLVPFAVIWLAHIGLDRVVGYGLKYPALDHATHLGWIGRAKTEAATRANAS